MKPKKKKAVVVKPKGGKAPKKAGARKRKEVDIHPEGKKDGRSFLTHEKHEGNSGEGGFKYGLVNSLLGHSGGYRGLYPPGFEKHEGKRLLAECPEFKLWELYHEGGPQVLETSEEIKTAEYKALWHSRDKDDDEPISIRIDRCIALHYLLRFKELGYWEGGVPTAKKMAETFMPLIEEALKADNTDQATTAADRAGNKLKGAILTLRRMMERKQSEKRFPAKVLLIRLAEGSFQYSKVRPRKSELQQNMEMLGYTFGGKDSAGKWRELFETSKLENLPE